MAKKAKSEVTAMQSSGPMPNDEYMVHDAVQTMLRHQEICDNKPLYRKATRQIRKLARSTSRGGRSR